MFIQDHHKDYLKLHLPLKYFYSFIIQCALANEFMDIQRLEMKINIQYLKRKQKTDNINRFTF